MRILEFLASISAICAALQAMATRFDDESKKLSLQTLRTVSQEFADSVEVLNATLSDKVLEYSKEITELVRAIARSDEIYASLNKFVPQTKHILKMGTSVSAVIAAGASLVLEPSSEELEAVKELHNTVHSIPYQIRNVHYQVERTTRELLQSYNEEQYAELVTVPMNRYDPHLSAITYHDAAVRRGARKNFIELCSDKKLGPNQILHQFHIFFGSNCVVFDEPSTYLDDIDKLQRAFKKIDKSTAVPPSHYLRWKKFKVDVIATLPKMDRARKDKTLQILSNATPGFLEDPIFGDAPYSNRSCHYFYVEANSRHTRDAMRALHIQVMADIAKLTMLVSQCSNITSNGSIEAIDYDMSRAASYIDNIISTAAVRLDTIENHRMWPQTQSLYATSALKDMEISHDEQVYSRLAKTARIEFEARGPESLDYYGLVTLHEPQNMQVCIIGDGGDGDQGAHTSTAFQFNTVDVYMAKTNMQKYENDQKKLYEQWFRQHEQAFRDDIGSWADDPACTLMNKLDQKYNLTRDFTKAYLFRKVQRTRFGSEIYVGSNYDNFTDQALFQLEYYWNNPVAPWTSTYRYRLFLLL